MASERKNTQRQIDLLNAAVEGSRTITKIRKETDTKYMTSRGADVLAVGLNIFCAVSYGVIGTG